MTTQPAPDGSLGGYRLVRRLGAGSRAEIYLGAGSTGAAALKIFRAEVPYESVGAELDALGRLDSPHFVGLRDVSSAVGDVPTLILQRVERGSIAALLRDRDAIEAGEAVTLLAPLAGALSGLHRSGVAHGAISASAVHVGAGGEPVLLGFGHVTLFARDASIAAIDEEPSAVGDREALGALALAVLARIRRGSHDAAADSLAHWVRDAPRSYEFAAQLEGRLFDLADAMPVEFGRPERSGTAVPARIGVLSAARESAAWEPVVAGPTSGGSPSPDPTAGGSTSAADHPALGVLTALLQENPLGSLRRRALAAAKGVRKPFWVAGGGVAVALVLAFALIPAGGPAQPVRPVAGAGAAPSPISGSGPAPTPSALPDDPLLALPLLLVARNGCIHDLSILCLDAIDEQSSAAFTSDSGLIQQIEAGGELPASATITASSPTLVERLGDSALVGLGPGSGPASVLMIRDEAGWRIRGFLSGVPSTGSPTS